VSYYVLGLAVGVGLGATVQRYYGSVAADSVAFVLALIALVLIVRQAKRRQQPARRGACPTCGAITMRGTRGTGADFMVCADPYHGPVPEPYLSEGRTFVRVRREGGARG
jgi:uncharacterized membrane protein YfcA